MADTPIVGWQLGSESIQGYLVVIVEVLQHPNDLPYRLDVGVRAILHLVQAGSALAVRVGEVHPQD